MNKIPDGRAICILGMHRTGTSSVARAMNLLGVYMGASDRMMPPANGNNPKGFWEHMGIVEIHENILTNLSRTWHEVKPMDRNWWKSSYMLEQKKTLVQLILEEFKNKQLWGWKDPRTCLMLPLWLEMLSELNIEPSFLITLRNPIDTAKSLLKRDNIPLRKSYFMWQLHITSALMYTRNYKRTIIHYDHFLDNWEMNLRRCAKHLNIRWPETNSALKEDMESFLDTGLRHSSSTLSDIDKKVESYELPESVAQIYKHCLRAEEDQNFLDSIEFYKDIEHLFYEHAVDIA